MTTPPDIAATVTEIKDGLANSHLSPSAAKRIAEFCQSDLEAGDAVRAAASVCRNTPALLAHIDAQAARIAELERAMWNIRVELGALVPNPDGDTPDWTLAFPGAREVDIECLNNAYKLTPLTPPAERNQP